MTATRENLLAGRTERGESRAQKYSRNYYLKSFGAGEY